MEELLSLEAIFDRRNRGDFRLWTSLEEIVDFSEPGTIIETIATVQLLSVPVVPTIVCNSYNRNNRIPIATHLSGWNPLYCDFFRLLPKLKKLKICGSEEDYRRSCQKNSLHDLWYLDHLEKLNFRVDMKFQEHYPYNSPVAFCAYYSQILFLPPPDAFPQYLKIMTFSGEFFLPWKDLSIVGKLPKLEALEIEYNPFKGDECEVIEQGFPSLKFLQLGFLNIKYWRTSSDHFACLQILTILGCKYLDSIPQDFAEITTLEVIDTWGCAKSVGNSAKQI
ncbi:PREDICTED: putative late blight resistance protein homolog R1C-3 [Nicotiana attenuata]|uniref:putative late blight resistance protein homolog R1C-3 n=1 Tax=Nicotiana attenuata TaxID=49451 RepID=UPI0009054CF5|nr:PREDICTED: putative late blight resistance protein homolog R1C-3 [Nicotiana attenuata]